MLSSITQDGSNHGNPMPVTANGQTSGRGSLVLDGRLCVLLNIAGMARYRHFWIPVLVDHCVGRTRIREWLIPPFLSRTEELRSLSGHDILTIGQTYISIGCCSFPIHAISEMHHNLL